MLKVILIVGYLVLNLVSCGDQNSFSGNLLFLAEDRCVHPIQNFQSTANTLDPQNRVTAVDSQGTARYLVKATWDLKGKTALVARTSTNDVNIEFFDLSGKPVKLVEKVDYRMVMDMGQHAHTTDECPAIVPTLVLNGHTASIKYINFVMGTRQPNKWFFHNLTADVNGTRVVVARLNIPHKVL